MSCQQALYRFVLWNEAKISIDRPRCKHYPAAWSAMSIAGFWMVAALVKLACLLSLQQDQSKQR